MGRTQNPPLATAWGSESPHRHQNKRPLWRSFVLGSAPVGRSTLRYYDARAGKAHPAQFSASLRIYGAKALRPRRAVSKLGACTNLNDLAQSEQIVVSCSDWARSFFSYLTDKTGTTRNCIQRRNAAMFQNLFAAVFLRRASQNQGSKFI